MCIRDSLYRGYNIFDIVRGFIEDKRYGYEEITYLLLMGKLPNKEQLEEIKKVLSDSRILPTNFTRDVIMKAPSKDMMNLSLIHIFLLNRGKLT